MTDAEAIKEVDEMLAEAREKGIKIPDYVKNSQDVDFKLAILPGFLMTSQEIANELFESHRVKAVITKVPLTEGEAYSCKVEIEPHHTVDPDVIKAAKEYNKEYVDNRIVFNHPGEFIFMFKSFVVQNLSPEKLEAWNELHDKDVAVH